MKNGIVSISLSAIVAFIGVIAGGVASIFTEEIKNAFPFVHFGDWQRFFSPSAYGSWSPEATTFWLMALIFFGLVFWRDYHSTNQSEQAQNQLLGATEQVQQQIDTYTEMLRTMPPQDFLLLYRDTYMSCLKAAHLAIETSQVSKDADQVKETLAEAIRTVLTGMVDLAHSWDSPIPRSLGTITYRANIMIYRSFSEMSRSEQEEVWKRGRFFVDTNLDAAIASIDGVLDLPDSKFTTTTTSRDPLPDSSINPIALPLTLIPVSEGKRLQNLPGAPRAFIKKKSEWILSPSAMVEQCQLISGLNNSDTISTIKKYYFSNHVAQSIVSIPLMTPDGDSALGVVNIYRNKDSILKDEQRAEEFDAISAPLCTLLVELLYEYFDPFTGNDGAD